MSSLDGLRLLLQSVTRDAGETVAALAQGSETARSTLFSVIGRAEAAGLVERDEAGRVRAGAGCGRLGFAALGLAPIYPIAEALLPILRDETDATVVLSAGDGAERIILVRRRASWQAAIDDAEATMSLAIPAPAARLPARLELHLRPGASAARRDEAWACLSRVVAAMAVAIAATPPQTKR